MLESKTKIFSPIGNFVMKEKKKDKEIPAVWWADRF